jgi:hypothetical protein
VILDPLRVAAKPVALMQHRHMTVGQPRAFVEMAAGKLTQAVKVRLDVAKQLVRHMDAKQVRERRIGAIEIHAGRIRRQKTGPRIRIRKTILRVRLH